MMCARSVRRQSMGVPFMFSEASASSSYT
jgi:hypothetical protein